MIRLMLALLLLIGTTTVLADEPKDKEKAAKNGKGNNQKNKLPADLQKLLTLLNEARAKEKLPPLKLHAVLTKVAQGHTDNMAKQEKMEHELDGKRVKHRVTDAGYDYRIVGENLASAEGDPKDPPPKPESIHEGWMNSKSHRANILSPKFKQIGLAVRKSKNGTYYYTQVFASPRE